MERRGCWVYIEASHERGVWLYFGMETCLIHRYLQTASTFHRAGSYLPAHEWVLLMYLPTPMIASRAFGRTPIEATRGAKIRRGMRADFPTGSQSHLRSVLLHVCSGIWRSGPPSPRRLTRSNKVPITKPDWSFPLGGTQVRPRPV